MLTFDVMLMAKAAICVVLIRLKKEYLDSCSIRLGGEVAVNDQIFQTPLGSLTKGKMEIARARPVEALSGGCNRTAVEGAETHAIACISGWAMINRQTVVVPELPIRVLCPHLRPRSRRGSRPSDPIGAIGAYWSQAYTPSQWGSDALEPLAGAAAALSARRQLVLWAVYLSALPGRRDIRQPGHRATVSLCNEYGGWCNRLTPVTAPDWMEHALSGHDISTGQAWRQSIEGRP